MEAVEGLRARKKRKTREAIVEAAMRLFIEKGFDETTVADIAAAADIAPRTFFAYFPAKEDVVFHDFDVALEAMHRRFSERPDGESAIDALRGWIAEMVTMADPDDEHERLRRQLITSTGSLSDHDRALRGHFQDALAQALRDDFGEHARLRAEMVAAAAVGALAALSQATPETEAEFDADPMGILDEALKFVRGGIDALEERAQASRQPSAASGRGTGPVQ